ncbi:N-acetyllactosaminide 3-alpha-galactosyltransferase [Onchocerca flexuosa]|uniref:Hexosyltransferase n=1 Tax=Onchocerca flexuosa TaxID=387005 RepID=A0A238C0J9_9BILA|nr:N-acetyllactosaminide 3-alpha-galactosyltransferase [Onchocerca flexuosa]
MPENNQMQKQLLEEPGREHDLIQQNFRDSCRNLTWKALMWLRFIDKYCPKVYYIMKLDDDVVGNISQMLHFMNERVKTVIYRAYCYEGHKRKILLGLVLYTNTFLPIKCNMINGMVNSKIDDYFITGILVKKAEAHSVDLKRKIGVYMWEGSEEALVNSDIFFRTLSNISHSLQLW